MYLEAKYVGDFDGIEGEIAEDLMSVSKILSEPKFKFDSAVAAINSAMLSVNQVNSQF